MSAPDFRHVLQSDEDGDTKFDDTQPEFTEVNSDRSATAVREQTHAIEHSVDRMPPWKLLLHNDDDNFMEDVVRALQELAKLTYTEAIQRMLEAHHRGLSLLMTTHREHAELLQEQFESKLLTVTIEPDC